MAWTPITIQDQYVIAAQDTHSITAEQFRVLHARLEQFQKLQEYKVLCVTSAVKGEGKTFTSVNLALTMARDFGKKVVLMDVDCRKSVVLRLAGQDGRDNPGWSDMISKKKVLKEILVSFGHEKLFLLPLGRAYSSSSNLIMHLSASGLLTELRNEFDYVVLDSPPILPVADMRILEDLVDGIILVARADVTTKDAVKKAIDSLKREKIIGFVLNDIRQVSKHYHYYAYQKHNNGNHV